MYLTLFRAGGGSHLLYFWGEIRQHQKNERPIRLDSNIFRFWRNNEAKQRGLDLVGDCEGRLEKLKIQLGQFCPHI